MNYFAAFDISASGMEVQKLRLDTVAMNLANAHTTRGVDGGPYMPLRVSISERAMGSFESALQVAGGAEISEVIPFEAEPRLVYQPGHPDADERGFVAFPPVDPVAEMVILMESVRAYEANVRALNAGKTMALRALDIGRN